MGKQTFLTILFYLQEKYFIVICFVKRNPTIDYIFSFPFWLPFNMHPPPPLLTKVAQKWKIYSL